jgi:hypothetical protein
LATLLVVRAGESTPPATADQQLEKNMRQSIWTALGAASLLVSATAFAQTPATPGTPQAAGKSGVNVGALTCHVADGMGFVFGSSKGLDCLFVRTDGVGERYSGDIKRFGVDIGYTKDAQMVWLVFAPGAINPGALTGDYGGVGAQATVVVGGAVNVLIGGSSKQITLQPVSVEGNVGLNVAAGFAEVVLKPAI